MNIKLDRVEGIFGSGVVWGINVIKFYRIFKDLVNSYFIKICYFNRFYLLLI